MQFINDNYGDLKNLNGSRCKTLQTAGEPRRFALYFIADLALSYRLNAVFGLFLLRAQSSTQNYSFIILNSHSFPSTFKNLCFPL